MDAAPDPSSQPQQLRQPQRDQAPQSTPAVAPAPDTAPTAAQQAATAQAGSAAVDRMAAQIQVDSVGRLTYAVKSTVAGPDGKFPLLPAGTIVSVDSIAGNKLVVHEITTGSQPAVTGIQLPESAFHLEPDMMNNAAEGVWEGDAHYAKVKGDLWNPTTGPLPAEARHQGEAGDCYFISSMAAVCAQNPKQIEALFDVTPKLGEPSHKSYNVSLYQRDTTGALVRKTVSVDHWLPEADANNGQSVPTNDIIYDGITLPGQTPGVPATATGPDPKSPHMYFWAELLEKAFAQINGSYNTIGSGGYPADGLEALTGVASTGEYGEGGALQPPAGMDVGTWALQKFQAYQNQNTAVVCGTLASWGTDKDIGPYGLYGSHAYQFIGVVGTNLIFKNPWGFDDPQPVPASDFLTVFDDVGSNTGNQPAPAKAPKVPAAAAAANAASAPASASASATPAKPD